MVLTLIWKIYSGLIWAAGPALWKKSLGQLMSNFWGSFFYVFWQKKFQPQVSPQDFSTPDSWLKSLGLKRLHGCKVCLWKVRGWSLELKYPGLNCPDPKDWRTFSIQSLTPEVEEFMVEKSVPDPKDWRTFSTPSLTPGLINPRFTVEKSWVEEFMGEKSGVEAWSWNVRGCNVRILRTEGHFQPQVSPQDFLTSDLRLGWRVHGWKVCKWKFRG